MPLRPKVGSDVWSLKLKYYGQEQNWNSEKASCYADQVKFSNRKWAKWELTDLYWKQGFKRAIQ